MDAPNCGRRSSLMHDLIAKILQRVDRPLAETCSHELINEFACQLLSAFGVAAFEESLRDIECALPCVFDHSVVLELPARVGQAPDATHVIAPGDQPHAGAAF